MRQRIVGIVFVVAVVRRVLWLFDDEVAEAGTVHAGVELSGESQHAVADRLGIELAAIHPPQIFIVAIDVCAVRIAAG